MSWPSTFLLATVKMLLLCSRLLTASGGQKAPQVSVGRAWGIGKGQCVLGSPTCIEGAVSDLELGFILIGNVLPCGQEHLPVWWGGHRRCDPGKP